MKIDQKNIKLLGIGGAVALVLILLFVFSGGGEKKAIKRCEDFYIKKREYGYGTLPENINFGEPKVEKKEGQYILSWDNSVDINGRKYDYFCQYNPKEDKIKDITEQMQLEKEKKHEEKLKEIDKMLKEMDEEKKARQNQK